MTLKDALKDLPPVDMSDVCQAAFSSRYMSRNRQRNFDEVSFTIPAMAKQVPLSPDSDGMEFEDVDKFRFIGKYRRLSYKEAAAIQTFPPEIEFCGDLDSKYRQIGNAVPVKLAESIAHEVKKILTSDDLTPFLNIENPEAEIYGPTADKRLTNTVLSGKAFEYATLIEIYRELTLNGWDTDSLKIIKDKNYKNVENAYQIIRGSDEDLDDNAQLETIRLETMTNDYNRAARVAAVYLRNVEPILSSSENLYGFLRVMPDNAGTKGDVRDINLEIYSEPESLDSITSIGISCKNNHEAVKHPRITEDPDFAKVWTNGQFSCSNSFIKNINEIFKKIDTYAKQYQRWADVEDKMDTIYYPIIKLFVEEIKRLGIADENSTLEEQANAKEFTQAFFEYMFGIQDFYKIIKEDHSRSTKVYPYNMHGLLMSSYNGIKNTRAVQTITMPEEIVEVRIKPKSKTTIEIYFDQWIISMRLHNADSKISKTSLKFDVQIKAQPRKVMGTILPWNN